MEIPHRSILISTCELISICSPTRPKEFHHKKRHADLKVGNNMTLETGVGKIFVKNQGKQLIQVGAVGYAEF